MATVKAVVLAHHKKKDGSLNVKIRVIYKRESAYIGTQHFLEESQINKDRTIKDELVLSVITPVVLEYRRKISELGERLELYTARTLAAYLSKPAVANIDLISFGLERMGHLETAGRKSSRDDMRKVVNSLRDYFRSEVVLITEIRSNMLYEYEAFLRKPRVMKRPSRTGKLIDLHSAGLSDIGVYNHMRDLRILFNAAVKFYNDSETDERIIRHSPFKGYKVIAPPNRNKRKLNIEELKRIRDCKVEEGSRMELAKELFMLSFYLCGMNSVDIYKLEKIHIDNPSERLEYYRSKTNSRRRDGAFISVAIPIVAHGLIEKYSGFLNNRYCNSGNSSRALSFGMRQIGEVLNIEKLQFYDARHAFADIARNDCGFKKDDVSMALNVKDGCTATTDIYLRRDWKNVDRLQRHVLSLLDEAAPGGFCNETQFSFLRTFGTEE